MVDKKTELHKKLSAQLDIHKLLTCVEGKIFLRTLMQELFFLGTTFDPDPLVMAFNEGRRSVVLQLVEMSNIDPVDLEAIVHEIKVEELDEETEQRGAYEQDFNVNTII